MLTALDRTSSFLVEPLKTTFDIGRSTFARRESPKKEKYEKLGNKTVTHFEKILNLKSRKAGHDGSGLQRCCCTSAYRNLPPEP